MMPEKIATSTRYTEELNALVRPYSDAIKVTQLYVRDDMALIDIHVYGRRINQLIIGDDLSMTMALTRTVIGEVIASILN